MEVECKADVCKIVCGGGGSAVLKGGGDRPLGIAVTGAYEVV